MKVLSDEICEKKTFSFFFCKENNKMKNEQKQSKKDEETIGPNPR